MYAVLHACPTCRRLLESPARSAGSETTCPNCQRPLGVPKDVLLPEPPASPDEFWFGFYCPSCSGEVATRAGDVGGPTPSARTAWCPWSCPTGVTTWRGRSPARRTTRLTP